MAGKTTATFPSEAAAPSPVSASPIPPSPPSDRPDGESSSSQATRGKQPIKTDSRSGEPRLDIDNGLSNELLQLGSRWGPGPLLPQLRTQPTLVGRGRSVHHGHRRIDAVHGTGIDTIATAAATVAATTTVATRT